MRVALMSSAVRVPDFYRASADEVFSQQGGNTGNVAFVNAIHSHLTGPVTRVDWNASPDALRQAGDIVVIACANQVGAHTDLAATAENLERSGLPVVALGLGAQAASQDDDVVVQDGTRRWLQVIAAQSPSRHANIGVRGAFTLRQLEKLGIGGHAEVTGCPSNLTNLATDYPSLVSERTAKVCRFVAGAIGHPFTPALKTMDRQVTDLVDSSNGTYLVQHGASMIKLAMREFDAVDATLLAQTRNYFRSELSIDEFKEWCRERWVVFGDADNWMAWLARYDFVVGPRFHGVMLALQAGTPAGCIAHDSRTLEMCETMAIPVRMYTAFDAPLSRDNLARYFPFDEAKYRATRARLARSYASILEAAGLAFDRRIRTVAQAATAVAA